MPTVPKVQNVSLADDEYNQLGEVDYDGNDGYWRLHCHIDRCLHDDIAPTASVAVLRLNNHIEADHR